VSACRYAGRIGSYATRSPAVALEDTHLDLSALYPVVASVAAYLLGSLSFAVIVSRFLGLNDPRTYGSRNPGATNVLRSGSRKAAALTLLLDAVKGWFPVFCVQHWGAPLGLEEGTVALVGLAAFLGHLYPVFFRFQGGKGVATAAGVLFGVHWVLGLATLVTWILIVVFFRLSSLAALTAAVFAPVYYVFGGGLVWFFEGKVMFAVSVMSLLLVYRHAQNIGRLLRGTEPRLGASKR